MAISLRRALLSCRNISLLIRTSRHFSHVSSSTYFHYPTPSHAVPNSPAIDFLFQSRRGFAKGRKQWDEDEDDDDFGGGGGGSGDMNRVEVVNVGPTIKAAAVSQMEAAIDSLTNELGKLRTGRASAGMLDHIIVETGGVKMPLNRIAVVSVLDPKTLAISPYDPNTLKELEKAIVSSPLGLNPKTDSQRLIAAIPPLTKEHMQAVCKIVAKSSEDVKQSIRRARQKALDTIKKSVPKDNKKKEKDKDKDKKKDKRKEEAVSGFSADDAKRLEKEVEELTKKYIKTADEMCKTKEKEITSS